MGLAGNSVSFCSDLTQTCPETSPKSSMGTSNTQPLSLDSNADSAQVTHGDLRGSRAEAHPHEGLGTAIIGSVSVLVTT